MSDLILPAGLDRRKLIPGSHRRGMKVLAWGGPKTGKSFFAASMPGPRLVGVTDDLGITDYLEPSDTLIELDTPESIQEFVKFGVANEDKLGTIILDPLTIIWESWMDSFNERFGGEIKGVQWNEVKSPWKLMLRLLMRTSLHVCATAWVNDIVYEQKEIAPGVKGKLEIFRQEVPKIEKKVPHIFDIMLFCEIVEDSKRRPTEFHKITYTGGRRPRSIAPTDLYVGKSWKFNSKKPVSPWETVCVPLLPKWDEGAVDHLGLDPQEGAEVLNDLEITAKDHALGQILRLIESQTDLSAYRDLFSKEIEGPLNELDARRKNIVVDAHNRKKVELGG